LELEQEETDFGEFFTGFFQDLRSHGPRVRNPPFSQLVDLSSDEEEENLKDRDYKP